MSDSIIRTTLPDGNVLFEDPGPGSHAFVALYNSTFPAPPGVDPGWIVSRADYGVPGHTPIARFDTEDEAKSAEYGLNDEVGWSDLAAYRIVASTMRRGAIP